MGSPDVIGPVTPLPTAAETYEAVFRLYVIKTLHEATQGAWTRAEALAAADNELENLDVAYRSDDPEDDARECLSYWDADE